MICMKLNSKPQKNHTARATIPSYLLRGEGCASGL